MKTNVNEVEINVKKLNSFKRSVQHTAVNLPFLSQSAENANVTMVHEHNER